MTLTQYFSLWKYATLYIVVTFCLSHIFKKGFPSAQIRGYHAFDRLLGLWSSKSDVGHLYLADIQFLVSSSFLAVCTLHL